MGITIKSKNFSADIGYGGFGRFRKKVATLSNSEFGNHYEELDKAMFIYGERDAFYKTYNAKTDKLLEANVITVEIANFCYQSDCEGSIDQHQAKQIYEKIKDYNDDICYGYAGRSDCAMFSDLKNIFKDCAENGGSVKWR
ncbi:hypothetical protein CVD28_02870 [Bacillus sp. M6-12]|uniref:hypothetical protein n=1 Tax=Bacillus sp. M6-12 TaxID=2054166 RepID=UPI000C76EE20|nr:hypothetical protein [Bacillus sp. M6-12]PLS19374.1 hypothetical protein CVD28_02870 [Bacillus sp. M6-12]